MLKKYVFYALIGAIGVQPTIQAGYVESVGDVAQTVLTEGEKIVVPLGAAMVNLGDACINGAIAGGRILLITTKIGAKCAYVLSEGCMQLGRFSAAHPEFVSGVAVCAGAAYLMSQYNRWQKKTVERQVARNIQRNNAIRDGRPQCLGH